MMRQAKNTVGKKRVMRKTKRFAKKRDDVLLLWRALARTGAVGIIFGTISYGMIAGNHITNRQSPLYNIDGKVAAYFGYAASEISIAGLKRQPAKAVLRAIRVRLNDSLIGFNPKQAQAVLEKVDWVRKAEVRRIYPNKLEIDVVEREPIAIWQRDGEFYIIDKFGSAFTSLEPKDVKGMIVVTGEGAHKHVFELVNHIEAIGKLKSAIAAAGWIGDRRWNLYLRNGIKVMLPETNYDKALKRFTALSRQFQLADKAVGVVDLRFDDRLVITPIKSGKQSIKVSLR